MSERWFDETLYKAFRQQLRIDRVIYQGKSAFQDILVFENARFGRVLALDGVVQTTEADEFCYHEMMAHVPILAHGRAKRVLIIGGGDGGLLEEVLKHDVERAVMVEIDGAVIAACRDYLPSICGNAFDDPRAETIVGDGVEYIANARDPFDVIIVDSTDPVGPAVPLFGDKFYGECRALLGERGIMISQSGVSFMQPEEAQATARRMTPLFDDATFYVVQVPTYAAGLMTLGWGCASRAPRATPPAELERRFKAAGITTRYYTPAVHTAAFSLPAYVAALVGGNASGR